MNAHNRFKPAAEKFLTGEYTQREANALAEWQQAELSREEETVSEDPELKGIKARMLHNIQLGIAEGSHPSQIPKPGTVRKSFWARPWISAAAILTLATGLVWAMHFYSHQPEMPVSLVFQNSGTEPLRQTLPDESIVWLSSQATLSLAEGFNQSERNVFLKGEAFFKVAKNSLKPFVVHTREVVTSVLGTSFNVKTFAHDHRVEVSVTEGKVSVYQAKAYQDAQDSSGARSSSGVRDDQRNVVLLANQRAVFSGEKQLLVKANLSEHEIPLTWKDRALFFNAAPVGEVIDELNNRFAAHIQPETESINLCRVKIDLSRSNLDTSLRMLCHLINAEYKKIGDRIIITGKGCPGNTGYE